MGDTPSYQIFIMVQNLHQTTPPAHAPGSALIDVPSCGDKHVEQLDGRLGDLVCGNGGEAYTVNGCFFGVDEVRSQLGVTPPDGCGEGATEERAIELEDVGYFVCGGPPFDSGHELSDWSSFFFPGRE
ncbi:MAG: hypothetical protein Q9216_005096 [Gyalolechia sp. 2 TL-2023]